VIYSLLIWDEFLIVIPSGYELPYHYPASFMIDNGAVVCFNREDMNIRKQTYKEGALGFDGDWIIKPDFNLITCLDNGNLVVMDQRKLETIIFDQKGKRLNLIELHGIQPNDLFKTPSFGSDKIKTLRQDALIAKIIVNKNVYKEALDTLSDVFCPSDRWYVLFKIAKPIYKYGLINGSGQALTEMIYDTIASFSNSQITCAKYIDDKGKKWLVF